MGPYNITIRWEPLRRSGGYDSGAGPTLLQLYSKMELDGVSWLEEIVSDNWLLGTLTSNKALWETKTPMPKTEAMDIDEQQAPRQSSVHGNLRMSSSSVPQQPLRMQPEVAVFIDVQPPNNVRTRTPTENRMFSVTASVQGNFRSMGFVAAEARLVYGGAGSQEMEAPGQHVLGGVKKIPIGEQGELVFNQLTMVEASAKHGEREFCIEFFLLTEHNQEFATRCRTMPFYAYSHKKVLVRRRNIKLRAIGTKSGPMTGGIEMNVIGGPFIVGPSLSVCVTTPHGTINLRYGDGALERYSDTVMFFTLPPYPRRANEVFPTQEVLVSVTVTNDGRTHSNAVPFTYQPMMREDRRLDMHQQQKMLQQQHMQYQVEMQMQQQMQQHHQQAGSFGQW